MDDIDSNIEQQHFTSVRLQIFNVQHIACKKIISITTQEEHIVYTTQRLREFGISSHILVRLTPSLERSTNCCQVINYAG